MSGEDAPPLPSQAEQALALLARTAASVGAEAYAVGGYVRDRLIGAPMADVDVLVTGGLREIAELVGAESRAAVVTLRDEHPTVLLVFADGSHIDVSLPRGQTPPVPQREPSPAAQDVACDLRHRDFTINAIALPLEATCAADWRKRVLDPTGGRADLECGLVRPTGPEVWRADPLRLLRAVRLVAQLGFDLHPTAESGIREHAGLITSVAPERIRDELCALLANADAPTWLARAADLGLLFEILPELAPLQRLAQGGYHHLDGWAHALAVTQQVHELVAGAPGIGRAHQRQLRSLFAQPLAGERPRLVLLKLAALMHDVGKPSTVATDDEGHTHFYGHERAGAEMAREAGRRLRLARREAGYLEAVTEAHMYPAMLARQQDLSRRAGHRFFRRTRDHAPDVLLLAWADRLSVRGPAAIPEHIERTQQVIRRLLAEWLDRGPLSHPQPPVSARGIMRRYGLQSGPAVGRLVEALSCRHAERPFLDAQEAWAFLDRVVGRPPPDDTGLRDDDEER